MSSFVVTDDLTSGAGCSISSGLDKENVVSRSGTESDAATGYSENKQRQKTVAPKLLRFVVLYGNEQFRSHFSFISPLLCMPTEQSIPGAYITLPDGSNFYAAKNISFILCLPSCSVRIFFYLLKPRIVLINFFRMMY